jgi:hypothetical protein
MVEHAGLLSLKKREIAPEQLIRHILNLLIDKMP